MTIRRGILAMVLLTAGCFDDSLEDGETGELGRGNFTYQCVNASDAFCEVIPPVVLAVGSQFRMTFSVEEGARPTVIAPAADLVRERNGVFEVLRAGPLPMLAVDGERRVVDLLHLRAAPIVQLRLKLPDGRSLNSLELEKGQSIQVVATPLDGDSSVLGGSLPYVWSSSEPALLRVETTSAPSTVLLRALGDGQAKLSIQLGTRTFEIPVTSGGLHAGSLDASVDAASDAYVDAYVDGDAAAADGGVP